ncbi:hypothetical protein [Chryseobacterium bernardetii]|uniref:hypothetical protein n=1 Tax=Chryseobacterium bernardetii TaxID=1241978 RepID=UPI000F4E56B6|nr:hypothetical protein [Chryseobacterium bernardetii]AZB33995.1 hypothetical protein EG351_10445 [Chryseobacterium bernardetii]
MKISSIKIFNNTSLEEIVVLKNDNEILEVFKFYGGISSNNIFEFGDSVYVTEEVVMNLVDSEFEVQVHAKFLQLISDVENEN